MKRFQRMSFIGINSLMLLRGLSLVAEEKVCHRCEEIREYNAKHHKNYEYYEDYIKDLQANGIPDLCPKEKKTPSQGKLAEFE